MTFVVVQEPGPPCPRCGRAMQICEHSRIGPKQLCKRYYYRRWFRCTHDDCVTTNVMWEQFSTWNRALAGRPEAIRRQRRG